MALFFSFYAVIPVSCGRDKRCDCSYIPNKANLFDCSSKQILTLPEARNVPNITNWIDFRNNRIQKFCGAPKVFLENISSLNLANNNISTICEETLDALIASPVQILDLRNNKLRALPKKVENLVNLSELWLSGNPFRCDCQAIWMKNWMDKFNNSGQRVIQDYVSIMCQSGKPIHTLDPVEMGCFPKELTLWQKLMIALAALVTIAIVIAIIAINRRLEEVKWFMYLHFDYLDKNDGDENIQNKDSDALVSYR